MFFAACIDGRALYAAAMPSTTAPGRTADRILDLAEGFVQRLGWNGFSYADIAAELGINKAAVHHHFASKDELGRALVARYHARFAVILGELESIAGAIARLRAYAALYLEVFRDEQRLCLCGM